MRNVRVGFWQNGLFVDFSFWAAGFLRGLSRRIFSHFFCGKKCPETSSRRIPGKILKNLYNKNPRHISAEGPAQEMPQPLGLICDSVHHLQGSLRPFDPPVRKTSSKRFRGLSAPAAQKVRKESKTELKI